MEFPNSEPQIVALAHRMLSGYFWHAVDFPSIPSYLRIRLFSRCRSYMFAQRAMIQALANLRIATKAKNNNLQTLKKIMKQSLQKSQVDVAANPEKLKLIGWMSRTQPRPAQLPGQPTNLQIITKDDAVLKLKWDRPAGTRRVRNYIIERRQIQSEAVTDWQIIKSSYRSQVTLTRQPKQVKLEYRIRASNNAGIGTESNTVCVVL